MICNLIDYIDYRHCSAYQSDPFNENIVFSIASGGESWESVNSLLPSISGRWG